MINSILKSQPRGCTIGWGGYVVHLENVSWYFNLKGVNFEFMVKNVEIVFIYVSSKATGYYLNIFNFFLFKSV